LRDIATQHHNWAKNHSRKWGVPIQDPPAGRDDFLDRYFRSAQPDQIVAIIKAREPATIMTAIGKDARWHLERKRRWVEQYNFYVKEPHEDKFSYGSAPISLSPLAFVSGKKLGAALAVRW
jgi:hypothetical protein